MLTTTIVGSLPKPAWLATPGQLWAPWRLGGEALDEAKRDAAILAVREQESAGLDVVTLRGKQVAVGAIDIATERVESGEQVSSILRQALEYVPAERLLASTNCGMALLRRHVAAQKLRALVQGASAVRKELHH